MFDDERRLNELMKLPALRGPALSIFVALLIAGRPLGARELAVFTGFANQAVTEGLKTLEILRAVIDRGRYGGWELAPNWRQLPLPLLFIGNHENHDSSHENHDSPHTRVLTATTTKLDQEKEVVVASRGAANHENQDSPVDNSIREWLIKGGVGPDSSKMHQLLAEGFTEEYAKAHTLNRLAAVEAGIDFTVGLLIKKLQDRDPAPPMRCEECLKYERDCRCNGQFIPDEYRGIIKR